MNLLAQPEKKTRILELDAVRALAAVSLMLFHFTHVYQQKYGYQPPLGFEFPYGKYGTQLFFLLSGYVNALTLFSKREPLDFLAARVIRIYPCFLMVIAINLLLLSGLPFTLRGEYSWAQVWANLTVVPNLLGYECLEPVTWTLQIEVLFYAFFLLMFCSGGLQRPVRTLMWYMAVCLAGTWWLDGIREELPGTAGAKAASALEEIFLLPYMPLFTMGILLYRLRSKAGHWGWNLFGLTAAFTVYHSIDKGDHNPVATILSLALLAGAGWGVIPVLRTWPFVFFSSISYSFYLLHNNLGTACIYHLNQAGIPGLVCLGLVLPLMVGVSAAVTFWIERPVSAWLRGKWKSWRQRSAASAIQLSEPQQIQWESGR